MEARFFRKKDIFDQFFKIISSNKLLNMGLKMNYR